jgi:chorismate synthase
MRNTFGSLFAVTTFGESHGKGVGAVVDGCPSRLDLVPADVQAQLDRRRPGTGRLTSARKEADRVRILSGVEGGKTLGTPILLWIANKDCRPGDYGALSEIPRPSHADYTSRVKYGLVPASGGGRLSARETVGRVAAGAVAEKFLARRYGVAITAWVSAVGGIEARDLTGARVSRDDVDSTDVRCPDNRVVARMTRAIVQARRDGDSLGGVVTCVCRGVRAGWGEPVFDKMTAVLAHAMMSIPASRGFEIGCGFMAAGMKGSQHNDAFVACGTRLATATNRSGGIQGGITNGEDIVFRVAFKPVPTIRKPQATVSYDGERVVLAPAKGRHDPCVVPRAVPVVEAMAGLVLADMALLAEAYGHAG